MDNLVLVYENKWIIESIYRESDRLSNKITNTTTFEDRCIRDVAQYLALSEENKENRKHIKRMIGRKVWEAKRNFKKEDYTFFSNVLDKNKEEGEEELDFEPEDVLADVEKEVMAKEMTALLAQDDHRKKEILGYWTIGNTNNAYISRSLARTFGGNAESHRKAINRFRKECHEYLNVAI